MTSPGPDPSSGQPDRRRELAGVLGVAALAGLAILLAAGRSWFDAVVGRRPPFGPVRVGLTGHALYPALTGLAVVALLAVVLVLVTGALVRRLLGALLVLAGGWSAVCAVRGLRRPGLARLRELLGDRLSTGSGAVVLHRHPQWAVLTLVAALALVAAGVAVLVRAGGWRAGLSSRYAAPAVSAEAGDPWRRLDRGEDPTVVDG